MLPTLCLFITFCRLYSPFSIASNKITDILLINLNIFGGKCTSVFNSSEEFFSQFCNRLGLLWNLSCYRVNVKFQRLLVGFSKGFSKLRKSSSQKFLGIMQLNFEVSNNGSKNCRTATKFFRIYQICH